MTQPVQRLNQFAQLPHKGSVAEVPNPVTISVQVYGSSTATLYPGDAVKLVDGTTDQILVDLCTVVGDNIIGWVIRNQKRTYFTAGQTLEIALEQSVIFLEAYGQINRGDKLQWYPSGHQVRQADAINSTCGTALDNAAATGDIIRVKFASKDIYSSSSCSSCSSSSCRSSSSCSSSSSCRSSSSCSSSSSSRSSSSSSSCRSSSSSSCRSSSSSSSAGA